MRKIYKLLAKLRVTMVFALCSLPLNPASGSPEKRVIKLHVTTELTFPGTPMDPEIDFGALIRQKNWSGVLNPNSIEVINLSTGKPEDISLSLGLTDSEKGRVRWVIRNPQHREYEIRFQTSPQREYLLPTPFRP